MAYVNKIVYLCVKHAVLSHFFDVTVVTHVTACDVRVIRKTNCTTMLDSSHTSASIAELIVPVDS